MDKVVNKTVDALTRIGERIERHMTPDETDEEFYVQQPKFPSDRSAFSRPVDKRSGNVGLSFANRRQHSYDNLAGSPGYNNLSNYEQYPSSNSSYNRRSKPRYDTGAGSMMRVPSLTNPYGSIAPTTTRFSYPYGSGIGSTMPSMSPINNPYASSYRPSNNYGNYPLYYNNNNNNMYGQMNMPYGAMQGNVAYAPDYYVAERRQIELIPAPQPQIIQQQVPVPVPVDRPVPQPYPVAVPMPYAVDRPVPVAVPTPVLVDRPVAVPVPVQSPPPPPICIPVPVPVPSPVPCYVPVGVPVPSPPPSPAMFEQSTTHTQRWVTGSPVFMNQPMYMAGSPVMGMNPYQVQRAGSFIY